ncbi:hypothetical protein [Halomonas sp. BC04]|uniref:hypothetical protein n=1 Tax=Halomonas sp. BC04 TaxID=1403540 RepID=UPI0012DC82B0|nr:hypothetical protein [Halomonas sp. BC04]
MEEILPELARVAQLPGDVGFSYVRALYVRLDNFEEEGKCGFSLMALLRADTPNKVQSELDDLLDELSNKLEENDANFYMLEESELPSFAEKESTITVSTLGRYVKFNIDSVSLSHGDPDVGALC